MAPWRMVEARTRNLFAERSTMVVLGLILSVFAVGFFCWLLFTLAIYALPLFVGVTAAFAAYHHGAGLLGVALIALVCGIATLAVGQLAFALTGSLVIRAAIALVFAVPAVVAGYSAAFGLAHIGIATNRWCATVGVIGAIFTGATAFARIALFAPPVSGGDPIIHHPLPAGQ